MRAITYGTELAVGLASVALGLTVRRSDRLRWLGVAFSLAGIAAIIHALVELVA